MTNYHNSHFGAIHKHSKGVERRPSGRVRLESPYKCNAAATRYKDAIGAIYIQGLTTKSDQVVSYPDLPGTRMTTPNACGYVRLTSPQDAPFTDTTTIKINSQSYTLESLSSVTAPSCRRIDDTHSKMMVPLEEADMWTSSN